MLRKRFGAEQREAEVEFDSMIAAGNSLIDAAEVDAAELDYA